MEIINRLKKTVLSLALVGFISAMFLSFLIFGLAVLSEITFENNLFLPGGDNPIRDLAITFLTKRKASIFRRQLMLKSPIKT